MNHDESRRIAREERYPDPNGSRTFCHELVDLIAGEAILPGRLRAVPEPTEGRRSLSPAKGSAIGRTQGAFHQGSSPRGWTWPGKPRQIMTTRRVSPVHRLFPSCGEGALAFFVPLEPCSDEAGRSKTRAP